MLHTTLRQVLIVPFLRAEAQDHFPCLVDVGHQKARRGARGRAFDALIRYAV